MNANKIIYCANGSVDFLRTFYDTTDKIARKYMARSLVSLIYFKPWSSPSDQTTIDALNAWMMIYSRGGIDPDYQALQEINRTPIDPKMPKKLWDMIVRQPIMLNYRLVQDKEE